jgi:hypothetical protein
LIVTPPFVACGNAVLHGRSALHGLEERCVLARELRERTRRCAGDPLYGAGGGLADAVEYGESNPTWTTVRALIAALGLSVAEFGRELDARQRR